GSAGACGASGVGVDAYADQPFGLWLAVLGATGQGCCHELGPDRQGGGAAVFPSTQWSGLVETDPDAGDVVAVAAGEPAILPIVVGPGRGGQGAAVPAPRTGGGAAGDHLLERALALEGAARIDDLLGGLHLSIPGRGIQPGIGAATLLVHRHGLGGDQRTAEIDDLALAVLDALDQPGPDRVTAVGHYRIAGGYLQRGQLRRTERSGQVARQVAAIEAETLDVAQGFIHAYVHHQPHGNQIA